MGDPEETQPKTAVSPSRSSEPVYVGQLSPALNDSGNIQAAQPQQPLGPQYLSDTDDEVLGTGEAVQITVYTHSGVHDMSEGDDPFIYGNADDGTSTQEFSNDQFSELDIALDGLTKDLFISKLLHTTCSSEDLVSRYRTELAVRAKRCQNGPTGALITRRSTAKGSVVEKYANDCHLLYEFINGNSVDVNELFKAQQSTHPSRMNSNCANDDNNPTLTSEIMLMKENITLLLTDVSMLKSNFAKTKETLTDVTETMKQDISDIKLELDECKLKCSKTINSDKYPRAAESTRLADKLSHVGWMLAKLDNSRILLEEKTRELEQNINCNSLGIGELKDREVAGNTALKGQIRDIREKIEESAASMHSKDTSDTNVLYMGVSKRLSALEKRTDEPKSSTLETAFKAFSNNVSTKIDKLCSAVELSIMNKQNTNINGNLNRDPQSGIFTRNPQTSAGGSCQTQSIPSSTTVSAPNPTEIELSDRRKSFVANLYSGPMTSQASSGAFAQDSVTYANAAISKRSDNSSSITSLSNDKNSAPAREPAAVGLSDKSESGYYRPIPVVNTSGNHDGRFRGVLRRKGKTYFLNGIDPDSNEVGVRDFLTENEVMFSTIKVFKPRHGDSLAAKITIWEDHAHIVESESFWPPGVTCKNWMTKPELRLAYKQRTETENLEHGNYNSY